MSFEETPSQTVGPYFSIGLPWEAGPYAVAPDTPGAVRIAGTISDGEGEPIPDALIETWQADPAQEIGGFRGFTRCGHEEGDGTYELVTIKPGPVPGPGGAPQAPHLDVSVFARGMLHRCVTRIYFADEPEANAADPVLAIVPEARRATLLARPEPGGYRFDIRLQGPAETVFFAVEP
ncbi:MAG: protocatechuate 3,4-dioxygenase subunit alpha [Actinomycetota bacterium]|nr:protocatechuate 3,4-dioxygenase subunit alpha [Actinomycetota bacterium]